MCTRPFSTQCPFLLRLLFPGPLLLLPVNSALHHTAPQQFNIRRPLILPRTPFAFFSESLQSCWTCRWGTPLLPQSPIPDKRFREGWRCPILGHPEYLLCLGRLGWDLWHVPGAVAPHLPQCPQALPFFCPQRLRGAQSCGLIAASLGTVAGPLRSSCRQLSSSFGTS